MIRRADFDTIVRKLGLITRQGDHLFAWFEHQGRVITRTRRSEQRGNLPMQHSIRQQLKLTEVQVRGIVGCSLDRSDYVEILRRKRLL